MAGNPKIADKKEYDRVYSLVGDHRYKVFYEVADSPFDLANGIEDKFMECVVVGSGYEPQKEIMFPDRSLTPSGTLYFARVFRKCDHDGSPHINVDDHLFYLNSGGNCFKCTAEDGEEHYYPIINASPLSTLINEVKARPNNPEGTLEEYVSYCASLDYVDICPGLPEKD